MQLKFPTFFINTIILVSVTPRAFAAEGDVLTATRVYQTIVSESPFFVDQTTVVTWTQSASITESTTVSPIPDTVETGAA